MRERIGKQKSFQPAPTTKNGHQKSIDKDLFPRPESTEIDNDLVTHSESQQIESKNYLSDDEQLELEMFRFRSPDSFSPDEVKRRDYLQAKSDSYFNEQLKRAVDIGHNLCQIHTSYPRPAVQPKLIIGKPNDREEQEADRVAEQVMNAPQPLQKLEQPEGREEEEIVQTKPIIQRLEESPNEEEEIVQTKPLVRRYEDDSSNEEEELMQAKPLLQRQLDDTPFEEEEELMQAKPIVSEEKRLELLLKLQRRELFNEYLPSGAKEKFQAKQKIQHNSQVDTEDLENKLNNSKGGGSPLPEETKGFMESRFNADFSSVRVHTDSTASRMNESIHAQAFTQGQDIYFNSGKYSPNSNEGKSLLAHELTHVLQQKGEEISQIQKQEKAENNPKKGNSLLDFLDYVWRTVIGDWSNEQDPLQILVNMGVGLIPVADQVLDLRDFTAHLYYMVFQKDYKDPMRWLALGLTAVGAIPFVGSIVKGLGKLAIFSDAAKAVGKSAEPLLQQIRRINPEWADIGRLKAAINENWDAGVTASKQAWMNLIANAKGLISRVPLPPSWLWGASKLRSAKQELLETISEIQKLSETMLDAALERIKREVENILNELDRIVKEKFGQPELVPERVPTKVEANRISLEPPQRDRPMQSEGDFSGNNPSARNVPSGMSQNLINIRSTLQDPRAVETFDSMFQQMKSNSANMERAIQGMQRSGSDIQERMLERWHKANPTPRGAALHLVSDAIKRGETLRDEIEAYKNANSQIKGINEWFKRLKGELDVLDEMKKGIKEATSERVQGSLNNISGIRAEFDYARKQPGVTGVNQEFNFVEKTGKRRKVDIDVIADNGKTWVDVKKVKPFSLNSTDWLGHPSGKPAGVQDQARRMLGAAQKNQIDEISPQIVFDFPLGVSSEVADALKNMGVTVKGQIIKNF